MARTTRSPLAWALLLAAGCQGADACGGCLAPIPGGFPAQERAPGAVYVNVSQAGFAMLETKLGPLIASVAGTGLALDVPCTDASQKVQVGPFQYTVPVYACDLNGDRSCTAADEDPALHPDEPGHGKVCNLSANVASVAIAPRQEANGDVFVRVTLRMLVKTGRIPLSVHLSGICDNLVCNIEYDSDLSAPPEMPVLVDLKLLLDGQSGDILTFDLASISDLSSSIDANELRIDKAPSSSCGWSCSVLDSGIVKNSLFRNMQGQIYEQIHDAIDQLRCLACDPQDNCPTGSSCHEGLCYRQYAPSQTPSSDVRDCPASPLGVEGRAALGETLGGFGGATDAALDVYAVAGGREADGKPSLKVATGGLVVGMFGGTRAPERARCVPEQVYAPLPRPDMTPFAAEAAIPTQAGQSIADYQAAVSLSRNYLHKALFEVWRGGLLCLQLETATVGMISSGLFQKTFLPSLALLTENQDVPMVIALRPRKPPTVVVGRGTTKTVGGETVPDDPLLTLGLPDLQIDFYAMLEERQSRLFSLVADVALPLSLEFDSAAGTVKPILAALDGAVTNVRPANAELLAEDPAELGSLLGIILGLAQPALAEALQPIALPTTGQFVLQVRDVRGTVPLPSPEKGYQHLAVFANLDVNLAPQVARVRTEARLAGALRPTFEQIREGARPTALVEARAFGPRPAGFAGYEYSWRADGGLWSPWTSRSRLEIAPAVLLLQGRHALDVRARAKGVPESADPDGARIEFLTDYEAPAVSLEIDAGEVRTVAHDAVTPAARLAYRYLVAGAWTEPGDAGTFALSEAAGLEVEVRDEAGFAARAALDGARAIEAAAPESDPEAGCAQAAGGFLAALALLVRRRRR